MTYAGNLTGAADRFTDAPLNTDDHPVFEYLAPLAQRAASDGSGTWLTGLALADLYDDLLARVPPETDPYLARLGPDEVAQIRAGRSLFRLFAHQAAGEVEAASALVEPFTEAVPFDVYAVFRDRLAGLP
jgi:hypothetical protein